jgi:hypothetical protein
MAKKEKVSDLFTAKAIRKLFPKEVLDRAKKVMREKEPKPKKKKG